MRTIVFILFMLNFSSFYVHAQIEFGIKAGVSSFDLAEDGIVGVNQNQQITLRFADAAYGHHFGVYTRLSILGIYIEPSMLFNSAQVSYKITEYTEDGQWDMIRNDTYRHIDIPVMAGLKVGFLRFQGGVVGHMLIDNASDIIDFDTYDERLKRGSFSWQAGAGIDLWRLRFDLNYEGNLSTFGQGIAIGGQEYTFSQNPSRILMTVGIKL